MKQLICLSHAPWSARPNRTQQLLTRLEHVQILFFEPPQPRGASPKAGLRVRPNIWVYTLPAPFPAQVSHPVVERRRQARTAAFLQRVARAHRFAQPVVWCTCPDQYFLADRLACRCLVYDCHREWDKLPLEWESELALAADVVFAASPGLRQRLAPCSDNIALLPNGANPRMFSRDGLVPPPPVASLPGPVLARVGDLTADLELDPLIYAAQRRPDWSFLLIGGVSRRVRDALAPFPNVHLSGPVPAVELPDYLAGCQALFDLLKTSRRGGDLIPCRIYEYFSTGKPVVAMVEPEQIEHFPDVVYTAYDPNGFLRRCQAALLEDDALIRARRMEYANSAAWSLRAGEVARILGDAGWL